MTARTPSDAARRGAYTVVAKVKGVWRAVATPTDRAGAVERFRATPGARLYGPDRRAIDLTPEESASPVYAAPAPTAADVRAAAEPIAPKRPRLADSLNVRMTTAMRQQIETAAADGARWPGGYRVEPSEVVREALRRYFEAP